MRHVAPLALIIACLSASLQPVSSNTGDAPGTLPVQPAWYVGELRPQPAASYWFAEGIVDIPGIAVDGKPCGRNCGLHCAADTDTGNTLRCVAWAQGLYQTVTLNDGTRLYPVYRVALPVVARK